MLYGEKMKQILEKFNVDTSVLPDSLYSTLLDAIYNVEISGEGGIDTSSATAVASDILKSKTAYAKGVKLTGTIESKGSATYTPSTTDSIISSGVYLSGNQTIKGDANLNSANIKKDVTIFGVTGTLDNSGIDTSSATAIASDILKSKTAYAKGIKITGTIESKGAETYTPKTTDQTINNGVYLSGVQTIKGDTNLNSANIKNGVTIFGVTGTLDDSGIDTSDATATTTDILKDKTAYSNGVKVTGTIESKSAETYTPSTTDTVINSGVYLSGNQTIKGDVNLVADNIKKDVTIFGVTGTLDNTSVEITSNPFSVTFDNLDNVTVTEGTWNKENSRIEF